MTSARDARAKRSPAFSLPPRSQIPLPTPLPARINLSQYPACPPGQPVAVQLLEFLMSVLSVLALLAPAVAAAPRAAKPVVELENRIGELEAAVAETLTAQPISPATALALPRDWRVCSPSRAQVMAGPRR
jgi:hypothetical protein